MVNSSPVCFAIEVIRDVLSACHSQHCCKMYDKCGFILTRKSIITEVLLRRLLVIRVKSFSSLRYELRVQRKRLLIVWRSRNRFEAYRLMLVLKYELHNCSRGGYCVSTHTHLKRPSAHCTTPSRALSFSATPEIFLVESL